MLEVILELIGLSLRFLGKPTDTYRNCAGVYYQYFQNKVFYYKGTKPNTDYKPELELATLGDIPKLATTTTAGIVKPDGTTVTINADGVISAIGEVSQQELADGLALKVNLTDYNNRVGSLESTVGEQAQTIVNY